MYPSHMYAMKLQTETNETLNSEDMPKLSILTNCSLRTEQCIHFSAPQA